MVRLIALAAAIGLIVSLVAKSVLIAAVILGTDDNSTARETRFMRMPTRLG
jgi:hypothetical protein